MRFGTPPFRLFRTVLIAGEIVTILHAEDQGARAEEGSVPDSWPALNEHVFDDPGCQILVQRDCSVVGLGRDQMHVLAPSSPALMEISPSVVANHLHICLASSVDLSTGLSRYRSWLEIAEMVA